MWGKLRHKRRNLHIYPDQSDIDRLFPQLLPTGIRRRKNRN
jgi:hypothetical protein